MEEEEYEEEESPWIRHSRPRRDRERELEDV
jgi:hypothetical protein